MKKRFTEAQIAFALRQATNGTAVAEIVRKIWISVDQADQRTMRWWKPSTLARDRSV